MNSRFEPSTDARADQAERVAVLTSYGVSEPEPETRFDALTDLAALWCNAPIASVNLIDDARNWSNSNARLQTGRAPSREATFCAVVADARAPLIVEDASADARFAGHPCVVGEPRIRFYAGVPLTDAQGRVLGTLCVVDHVARTLDAAQRDALERLAGLAVDLLHARRRSNDHAQAIASLDRDEDDILIVRAEDARVVYANRSARSRGRYPGAHAAPALPCALEDFVAWRDFDAARARLAPVFDRTRQQIEFDAFDDARAASMQSVAVRAYGYRNADRDFVMIRVHAAADGQQRARVLDQARDRARQAVEVAGFGVVEWNLSNNLGEVSANLRRLFALPANDHEIARRDWWSIVAPEDELAVREAIRRHAAGRTERYAVEYRVRLRAGGTRRIREIGRVLKSELEGEPDRLLALICDAAPGAADATASCDPASLPSATLGERQRATALRAERERGTAALDLIGQRLFDDISSPLRIVSMFMRNAAPAALHGEPALSQRMDMVVEAIGRVERVAGALAQFALDLQRPLDRRGCHLQREFMTVWTELGQHDAKLTVGDLPIVYADGASMRRLAEIVLSNALKFASEADPIEIDVRVESYGAGEIVFAVRDNGIGLAGGDPARLFQPFARLHGNRFQGIGLGLAAMRSLVERHGGRVWAASNGDASGTTFYFALPERRHQPRLELGSLPEVASQST